MTMVHSYKLMSLHFICLLYRIYSLLVIGLLVAIHLPAVSVVWHNACTGGH
jgi:hypothetical protein